MSHENKQCQQHPKYHSPSDSGAPHHSWYWDQPGCAVAVNNGLTKWMCAKNVISHDAHVTAISIFLCSFNCFRSFAPSHNIVCYFGSFVEGTAALQSERILTGAAGTHCSESLPRIKRRQKLRSFELADKHYGPLPQGLFTAKLWRSGGKGWHIDCPHSTWLCEDNSMSCLFLRLIRSYHLLRFSRCWWASRLCTLRIRGFSLLINVAVPSTAFQ